MSGTEHSGENVGGVQPFFEVIATDLESVDLHRLFEDQIFDSRALAAARLLRESVYPEISEGDLLERLTGPQDPDQRRGVTFNLTQPDKPAVTVRFEPLRLIHGKLLGDLYAVDPSDDDFESSPVVDEIVDAYEESGIIYDKDRTMLGLHSDCEELRSFAVLEEDDNLCVDAQIVTVVSDAYREMSSIDASFMYKGLVFILIRASQSEPELYQDIDGDPDRLAFPDTVD